MRVKVNHYCGAAMLNTLRQIALTRLPETRPIAYKVGAFSNVLAISDSVEEDMTEFISKVASSSYQIINNDELLVYSCTVNELLSIDDLSGNLLVTSRGAVELLHCVDRVSVDIIFRTAAGKFTQQENANFLKEHGIMPEAYVTTNSRHTPTASFSFNHVAEVGEDDEYEISIYSKTGVPPEKIFQDTVKIYREDAVRLHN